MEPEILKKFEEQEEKLNKIYQSVEKTRKYFLWTLIATIAFFVLPLIGILVMIPTIINFYSNSLSGM